MIGMGLSNIGIKFVDFAERYRWNSVTIKNHPQLLTLIFKY